MQISLHEYQSSYVSEADEGCKLQNEQQKLPTIHANAGGGSGASNRSGRTKPMKHKYAYRTQGGQDRDSMIRKILKT